jgi:hypothetical protein
MKLYCKKYKRMGDSKNSIAMNNRQPEEMQEKNESNDSFFRPTAAVMSAA